MATENVGGIEYTVDANVDPLLKANKEVDKSLDKVAKGFDDTDKKSKKFDTSMTKSAKAVGSVVSATKRGAIALTAFTAALTAATAKASAAGRELDTMAKLSNTTVERFQELAAGAQEVGVSTEKLGDIFKDTQDKIGDFINTGGGELKDYFENIAPLVGQTAEEFKNLSGPDALIKFQEGLDAANLSASEQIFFLESLANDASILSPLLQDNARGFEEAAKRARDLNLVLSQSEVDDLKDVNKEWNILLNTISKSTQKIVAENAPQIIAAFQKITEVVLKAAQFINDVFDSFKEPDQFTNIESLINKIAELKAERGRLGIFSPDEIDKMSAINGEIFLLQQQLEKIRNTPIEINSGAGQDKKGLAPLSPDKNAPLSIFDTEEGGFGTGELNEELNESLSLVDQLDAKFNNLGNTIGGIATDSALAFTDQLGQGMAQAIVDGDSLEDTFRNIAGTIGTQLLGSLISLGLQYGINAALKATADQTEAASATAAAGVATAAGVASATTLATAYAPAAAAASIATFGGAAVAGTAALTTTYATSNALALSGGRQNGGPVSAGNAYQVTEDGNPEMLTVGGKSILMMGNQGGTVTSNKDMMSSGSGGGAPIINIYEAPAGTTATATQNSDAQWVIDVFAADMNARGKAHKSITNTTTANNKTRTR